MLQTPAAIPSWYYCCNWCFASFLIRGELRILLFPIPLPEDWQPRPGGAWNMRYKGLNTGDVCPLYPLWNERKWKMEGVSSWNLFSFLALQLAIGIATTAQGLGNWFFPKAACASSPKGWSRDICSQQSQSSISESSQLCNPCSCYCTQWPGDYEPSLKSRLKSLENSPVLCQSIITRLSWFIFNIDTKNSAVHQGGIPWLLELENSFV